MKLFLEMDCHPIVYNSCNIDSNWHTSNSLDNCMKMFRPMLVVVMLLMSSSSSSVFCWPDSRWAYEKERRKKCWKIGRGKKKSRKLIFGPWILRDKLCYRQFHSIQFRRLCPKVFHWGQRERFQITIKGHIYNNVYD